MNEIIDKVYDEARSAWRFRWVGMSAAAAAAAIGWLGVFALPDRYEANASVFVDTRTALKPLLQGLTMEQDVNVQLNYVRQSLLSGDRVQKIARDAGILAGGGADPGKTADVLADFTKRITLDVRSASGREDNRESAGSVYSFQYQDSDRARSLKVTEIVMNTFIEETLGGKRAGAQNAQKFLEAQIKSYEERLRTAENRLAEFKKSNIGLMPTEQGGYFAQLQGESDLAKKIENDLNVAASRRAELSRQLRGESVIGASSGGPVLAGGILSGGSDSVSRIKETQAKLDDLLLRFTEKHPDVIAMRATLAELRSRREAEIESLRRGDAGAVASSGVSSNPVYQSIQLQLNQADVEIASLRGQLGQHRSKAAELRQRLDVAPQVEAQFAQLNRDYEVNKTQYTTLLANYEKAQLGERADDAGSVRFEVVQPPTAPYGPVFPRRNLLLAGVLFGALAVGGGIAFLLHLLSPVVGSVRGLTDMSDIPVLGVVSAAFPREHSIRARGDLLRFVAAGGVLAVVFVAVVLMSSTGWRVNLNAAGMG
jgi:polysaccharide chain length determinant protein (PEP-CTERM system associated)